MKPPKQTPVRKLDRILLPYEMQNVIDTAKDVSNIVRVVTNQGGTTITLPSTHFDIQYTRDRTMFWTLVSTLQKDEHLYVKVEDKDEEGFNLRLTWENPPP